MSGNSFNPDYNTSGHAVLRHIVPASNFQLEQPYSYGLEESYVPGASDPLPKPPAHTAESWNAVLGAKSVLGAMIGSVAIKTPELNDQQADDFWLQEVPAEALPGRSVWEDFAESFEPGLSRQEVSQVSFELKVLDNKSMLDQDLLERYRSFEPFIRPVESLSEANPDNTPPIIEQGEQQ